MVLIVLVVIANSQLSPYFLDVRNLFRASSDFLEIGLMMLPMVLIIVTGNVDLAVASTLGMTASFMGLLFNNGLNIWIQFGLPVINQPQVAILGVGAIEKRAVVIDDLIGIRLMGYLALGYDHRLVDGAVADQFMADLKKSIEHFDPAQV